MVTKTRQGMDALPDVMKVIWMGFSVLPRFVSVAPSVLSGCVGYPLRRSARIQGSVWKIPVSFQHLLAYFPLLLFRPCSYLKRFNPLIIVAWSFL